MKVHITNLYGVGGTASQTQQSVADIAKKNLHYNELGIFCYEVDSDTQEMLRTRIDGIIAAVGWGDDVVIYQSPSWNGIRFDEALIWQLGAYGGLKKIFFIHDVPPLMFESNRYLLKRYIDLYNQADLIILPSQNMEAFLRSEGLLVPKIMIQKMWDFPVSVDLGMTPHFNKMVSFASDTKQDKFLFAQKWKSTGVKLAVTAREGDWEHGENIRFMGWFSDQNLLANELRRNGGFGLLWTEDADWKEYMRLNACSKLGLYLASGLPVIVHNSIPEADTILRKNLGFAVDSLDEAVEKIESTTEEQYNQMVHDVGIFGELIRGGYFTKKLLTDAVFHLLYD
ncbi:MAG: sugar transferase [Lachnospiraceae bacterium]|nr:sugar transferase [Lachnospiraceae bacterium]